MMKDFLFWILSVLGFVFPQFKRGLVPISADPITKGHIDLIRRAAPRCETLVVLIANNESKLGKYTFSLEKRLEMAKHALASFDNVEVIASGGLLVDNGLFQGCDVVFRGIRNRQDREYELQQMRFNNLLEPGFVQKIRFLRARRKLAEISSTLVKEFVRMGVDVSPYVPLFIKAALEKKLRGQVLVGIAGGIASGKTWVAQRLAEKLEGTYINFDVLIRELYDEQSRGAQLVREKLVQWFGPDVLCEDGSCVDREILKARMFGHESSKEMIQKVVELTTPHVMRLYRSKLNEANGFVLVEWAQMAKMGMAGMVNNHVIVVEAVDRDTALQERGIDPTAFARVSTHQWSAQQQVEALQGAVERDGFGQVFLYQNDRDPERSAAGLADLEAFVRSLK